MAYDNSSTLEPKRSHQWFMDGAEPELVPNKKQAIELPNHNSFSGLLSSNIAPWMSTSSFHSVPGQYAERLFDNESARSLNFDDRSVPSVGLGNMNVARKVMEESFGSDSSFGLSISHTLEDPRSGLNFGGIRKVKVSQVKEAENFMPVSMGDTYTRGITNAVPADHAFSKAEDCIAMGLSFNRGDDQMMSLGDTFNREDNNFISMSQPFNKVDSDEISASHSFKESDSLSMSHSFSKDESNITMLSQSFSREDDSTISVNHSFKDNNTAISMGQPFSIDDSNITAIGQTLNEVADTNPSTSHCYNKVNENTIAVSQAYNKVDNNNLSMSHSFGRGESNIISFGGFNDDDDINASGRLICSYDLLMSQSPGQRLETVSGKRLVDSNANTITSAAQLAGNKEVISKKEEQKANKKHPSNSFPSNVRSLLSTGMLDGVAVKYIAWSREKELRGIIKGSGYLCGCQSCNFSKAINAYEFERHASCKTKHPNNHIYFENGKTIYGIVQELRNTPQDLLFEVIQTITGSPINQKSFRIWKESFLAATRELQRIYGKDEVRRLS